MSSRFNLGIVGTGRIVAESHLPAALALPAVNVAALVDVSIDAARSLAEGTGIEPIITDRLRNVLGEVDAVLIATPNNTHHDLAIECLEAGVPVLIEKPLATTTRDAEAIARVAEASGVTSAVGFCTRFYENVRLMHRLLRADFFGAPRRFAYQMGTAGGYAPESGYNLDMATAGGGVLIVNGIHFLDRMLYWFGYPDEFEYEDDACGGPEASAVAQFRYCRPTGDCVGVAHFSKAAHLPPGFVLETEKGIVVLREGPGNSIDFHLTEQVGADARAVSTAANAQPSDVDIFQLQLDDFVQACIDKREPMVPLREGVESVRLIDALYSNRKQLEYS